MFIIVFLECSGAVILIPCVSTLESTLQDNELHLLFTLHIQLLYQLNNAFTYSWLLFNNTFGLFFWGVMK